jgi:formate hydrogenlyase subunit 4
MIEQGSHLEHSGRALALLEWADAMKLTFALSLLAVLILPWGIATRPAPLPVLLALLAYIAKMGVLLLVLAVWENSRGKLRLRAIVTPLLLATGVLLFTVATLVVSSIQLGR